MIRQSDERAAVEALEVRLLLEAVHERYGLDFREYAGASVRRRIRARLAPEGVSSISELQAKVLHDPQVMERLLLGLTVHVTSMFRHPSLYLALRREVVPLLRTYPFVRIWLAGCSTGEEVYSIAILLEEEGLYERCRIYATDLSETVLARAKHGVFPLSEMKTYTENYQAAGGTRAFSDYYRTDHERALLRPELGRQVVFAQHNLVTDGAFNQFQLVLCRNVMIYFNPSLQERVHRLIYESLERFGYLVLGEKESIRFSPREACYEAVRPEEKLYRKVG
ncbi:MAG: protein-glutamate O-methyltransferase CheR [Deltaproteobacteria bacterium]|nr:protein-glutamate O-methyltransferase CheR [Deltaproteobacteria bacterium]